jgi:hypothetical protein
LRYIFHEKLSVSRKMFRRAGVLNLADPEKGILKYEVGQTADHPFR